MYSKRQSFVVDFFFLTLLSEIISDFPLTCSIHFPAFFNVVVISVSVLGQLCSCNIFQMFQDEYWKKSQVKRSIIVYDSLQKCAYIGVFSQVIS